PVSCIGLFPAGGSAGDGKRMIAARRGPSGGLGGSAPPPVPRGSSCERSEALSLPHAVLGRDQCEAPGRGATANGASTLPARLAVERAAGAHRTHRRAPALCAETVRYGIEPAGLVERLYPPRPFTIAFA